MTESEIFYGAWPSSSSSTTVAHGLSTAKIEIHFSVKLVRSLLHVNK
jgi:hypothetical protein